MFTCTISAFQRFLPVLLACSLLGACASRPPITRKPLALAEGTHAFEFTLNYRQTFEKKLNEMLYGKDGVFVKSTAGNVLHWEVVKADPGSRALRYFVGFGAGKGIFLVRTDLMDRKGKMIAGEDEEGDQVMGVAGGSYDSAIEEAAEKVARFAERAEGIR